MDEFYVEEPPPEEDDDEEEESCLLGELEGERLDGMARGEQEEQEDYRRHLLRMVKKISLVRRRVAV